LNKVKKLLGVWIWYDGTYIEIKILQIKKDIGISMVEYGNRDLNYKCRNEKEI